MIGFLLKELALKWGILLLSHIGFAECPYGASSVPIGRIDHDRFLIVRVESLV